MTTYARTTNFAAKTTLLQQDVVTEAAAVEASYNAINKDQTSKVDTLPRQLFANPGGINVLSMKLRETFTRGTDGGNNGPFESVYAGGSYKNLVSRADANGDPYGAAVDARPTSGNYIELLTIPVRTTCRPIFGVLTVLAERTDEFYLEADTLLFRLIVNARVPVSDPLADNPVASFGKSEGVVAAELSGFNTPLYPYNVKQQRTRQQFALAVSQLNRGDTLTLAMSLLSLPTATEWYGLALDMRCDIWCSALQIAEDLE